MIKIEVTGNSIPEVADKLLSLGAKLRYKSNIVEMANAAAVDMRAEYEATKAEVAEAAPVDPTPARKSAPAASELSVETDVTPVVLAVVQTKGKPVVEEILSQFGVARASQLDPARWPELVAALQDKL